MDVISHNVTVCNFFKENVLFFSVKSEMPILFFMNCVKTILFSVKRDLDPLYHPHSYHGAARCNGRKFCSEFFTPLFEHFCVHLRLHQANHSDLGIIGKILSCCGQKLSINDDNFGQE